MNDVHRIADLEERVEKLEDKLDQTVSAMMDMIDRLHGELVGERNKVAALSQQQAPA